MLLLVGCEFPTKYICIDHNDVVMERTDQRHWRIMDGVIKIKIGECDELTNQTNSSIT